MAASVPDRLTSLPAELLIRTLEVLPARKIYSLRILSKACRASIDNNEEALTRLTANSNRERLYTRLRWLLHVRDLDLIDILHRFTSYYGNIGLQSPPEYSEHILSSIVGLTMMEKFPDTTHDHRIETGEGILEFWLSFMECHT